MDQINSDEQKIGGVNTSTKERIIACCCHLGGIMSWIPLIGVGVPFVIWQVFKGELLFIDTHGKNAFNFQMTLVLLRIPSYVLMMVGIGFLMIFVIEVVSILFSIIASIRAYRGLDYGYPFRYPFIR